jgi:Domain of unknown function (DUF222)
VQIEILDTQEARRRSIEELGDEITTLAGHIHAATCRWLCLIAEFDAREGWVTACCHSCAHWVSWRCSIAPGPAREHVRVARRLQEMPVVRGAFARGELSYSKVRALTRVDAVEREEELVELALVSTAAQLERIVRGYRRVATAAADRAYAERYLSVSHDDDGGVVIRGRLPRDDGALLLKALEVARGRLTEAAGGDDDVPAGTSDAVAPARAAGNADALVELADVALAASEKRDRSAGDRYQVLVHVDADTLAASGRPAGDAAPSLDDGAPLAAETARRLCCDASLVGVVACGGEPLSVGRKTRSIPPALRRALRTRDGGCGFPGCDRRHWIDAHHVRHWADGGDTSLRNLVQLCRHHHRLLHEGGFTVRRRPGPEPSFEFRHPSGRPVRTPATRGDPHDLVRRNRVRGLDITAETSVPLWSGERLDLRAAVDALLATAAGDTGYWPPGHPRARRRGAKRPGDPPTAPDPLPFEGDDSPG